MGAFGCDGERGYHSADFMVLMKVQDAISKICVTVMAGLLIYCLGWHQGCKHKSENEAKTDTLVVERWDTAFIDRPTEIVRYVTRHDTIRDTSITIIVDSTNGHPTAIIPIEQAIYRDSTENAKYVAYVSGYRPSLDSITINCMQKTEIITKIEREKQRRIGFGAQIGVGYAGKLTPYVGLGLQYRIW